MYNIYIFIFSFWCRTKARHCLKNITSRQIIIIIYTKRYQNIMRKQQIPRRIHYFVVFSFTLYSAHSREGRKRPGNLVLRHSVPIRTLPFSTFRCVTSATTDCDSYSILSIQIAFRYNISDNTQVHIHITYMNLCSFNRR